MNHYWKISKIFAPGSFSSVQHQASIDLNSKYKWYKAKHSYKRVLVPVLNHYLSSIRKTSRDHRLHRNDSVTVYCLFPRRITPNVFARCCFLDAKFKKRWHYFSVTWKICVTRSLYCVSIQWIKFPLCKIMYGFFESLCHSVVTFYDTMM